MNVESIFNAGGTLVENPDWSPTNSTVPRYINVSDIHTTKSNNLLADFAYDAAASGNQSVLARGDISKYTKYGITPNKYNNIDAELADAQSNWKKAGNMLAQSIVSEIGLGTIRGFADMFDFVASNILHITEQDYQNPASAAIQEWQEAFKNNVAPIYTTPGVDIQNGGFRDFGWWMSNMPTVFSILSLLIPARGVTGTLGVLQKAGKAGKFGTTGKFLANGGHTVTKARKWATGIDNYQDAAKLDKWVAAANSPVNIAKANYAAKTVAEATLMRTIENYQEARETYIPTYQAANEKLASMNEEDYKLWLNANKDLKQQLKDKNININDRDAVAKFIAKKAADRTFAMDWSNLIWDTIQLHGLNNIGKGIEKATGRVVRGLQEESKAAAGAFAKGATETVSKTPWYKNVGTFALESSKDLGKLVITEGNEAVEEAVNYIAQQEGLTYGKLLLDATEDPYGKSKMPGVIDSWRLMQGNLKDYMKSSELQESAFWGLMGGVTFGVLGGGMNRVQLAMHRKAEQKAREENPVTGEKIDTKDRSGNSWYELLELPARKAAREAMNRRITRLNQVSADLKAIEDGNDIYAKRDESGNYTKFEGSPDIIALKKEIARKQVENQFIADIAMDAMNSGTFDLLLDYFEDDRVRQAMVTAGLTTDAESRAYVSNISQQLKNTKDLYTKESAHILNQATAINADRNNKEDIPLPYIQLMAKQNMDTRMGINTLDKQIMALEAIAGEQEVNTENAEAVLFNGAKEAVTLGVLIDTYGHLSADERALEAAEPIAGLEKIAKQRQLADKRNRKKAIAKEISKTTLNNIDFGRGALFNAFREASMYVKNPDGKYDTDTSLLRNDAEILKDVRAFFGDKADSDISDESIIQSAKKLTNDFEHISGKQGLVNANEALFNTYTTLAMLNAQKADLQSQILSTKEQIAMQADYLHNEYNEARKEMVGKAVDIIAKAIEQYNKVNEDAGNTLIDAIYKAYNQDKQEARRLAEEAMATIPNREGFVTAEEFLDALDILHFSSATNDYIMDYIQYAIDFAIQSNQQKEANQNLENGRNQNGDTASNDNGLNISTTNNQNGNTEQQGGQQNNVSPSISNQIAKHGQIVGKRIVKVIFNNQGNIVSIKKGNNRTNKPINAYIFEDGTIFLDVEALPKAYQLDFIVAEAFQIQDGFDILDENTTWKIDTPIELEVNRKEYKIANPGYLIDVNTSSPVEDSATSQEEQTPATQEQTPVQPPVQTPPIQAPNDTPNQGQQIPSTGQLDEESQTPSQQQSQPEEPAEISDIEHDLLEDRIAQTCGTLVSDIFADGINYDELGAKIKENIDIEALKIELNMPNLTEEDIDNTINSYIEQVKEQKVQYDKMVSDLDKSATGMAFAARFEEVKSRKPISTMFTNVAEQFLKEYEQVVVVPELGGKKLVSLEEILRICQKAYGTQDKSLAKHIYEIVRKYLLTSGQYSYIVTDENVDPYKVLDNLDKTVEEIQEQEHPTMFGAARVNFMQLVDAASVMNRSMSKDFFDALNALNVGDKVQVYATEEELIVKSNGVTIGSMAKPKLFGDEYRLPVQGWNVDVKLNANGNPVSRLKDLFTKLFTDNDEEYKELRQLLVDYTVGASKFKGDRKAYRQELINKFERFKIIQDIVSDSKSAQPFDRLVDIKKDGTVDYESMLQHLVSLWNFTYLTAKTGDFNANIETIKSNLNRWFYRLYNNYDMCFNVTSNIESEVVAVNEGELIRVTKDSMGEGYESMPLPTQALDEKLDAKIAIVDPKDDTKMLAAGKPISRNRTFRGGDTLLAIFSRNTMPDYVKAVGVKLNDANAKATSPEFVKILQAVEDGIRSILTNCVTNPSTTSGAEFEQFIKAMIDGTGSKIPLFRSMSGDLIIEPLDKAYGGNVGYNLLYKKNGRVLNRLRIYTRYYSPGHIAYQAFGTDKAIASNTDGYSVTDANKYMPEEIAKAIMEFLKPIANINISAQGIKTESDDNGNYGGFINRKDGKLVVDIPNRRGTSYHKEFNSYNDFLMKGGLVRVNTKKDKNGSNFKYRGDNQLANKNLFISLPTKQKQTTNISTTTSLIDSETDANTFDKAIDTIENQNQSDDNNVSGELVKLALGEEEYGRFNTIFGKYNILDTILPTSMYYEPRLNHKTENGWKGVIAYSKVNGKSSIKIFNNGVIGSTTFKAGERMVVGPRFINMLASKQPSKRREAIRKLIHEQLHLRLDENPEQRKTIINRLKSIYNEYKAAADSKIEQYNQIVKELNLEGKTFDEVYDYLKQNYNNNLSGNGKLLFDNFDGFEFIVSFDRAITVYKGDRLIEEFLVESLTSKGLYDFLNSIEHEAKDKSGDSLFTRIIKAIAEFFGWDIVKDNTLLMHELNTLREVLDGKPADTESETEITTEVEPKGKSESEKTESPNQEPQLNEEGEDDSSIDYDYDEDYDNDALASNIEDIKVAGDDVVTKNIDAIRKRLPSHLHAKFTTSLDTGSIKIKCW